MAKKKFTVPDFKSYKENGKKFSYVTGYDYTFASMIDESEIEAILVGDSLGMVMMGRNDTVSVTVEEMIHHGKAVVTGAPNTFVIIDMPFGSYNENHEQAIHNASRLLKETGGDAVKLEGGKEFASTVAAITRAGIPVIGHIGMTPQTASNFGGFKVQGATKESALELIKAAKTIADAGAIALCVECVPSVVGEAISKEIDIPTMGIGAGPRCDSQVLVLQDMLGMYSDFKPKFVKQYADIKETVVNALNQYHYECSEGLFPTPEYSFNKAVEL